MALVRIPYVMKSGILRIYEYLPPVRLTAADRCGRALRQAGTLTRVGPRTWRAGVRGRIYIGRSVDELVRRGKAVIDGDIVRVA